MKKVLLLACMSVIVFYSCTKNYYISNFYSLDTKKKDSITDKVNSSYTNNKKQENDFLLVSKDSIEGFLLIDYKLSKINKEEDTLRFRYFNFDDNIFPINGVGVIKHNNFKLEKHTVVNDSIFFLPVIANNNCLSLNIINLKTKQIITSDIRTSLSFIWVTNEVGKIKFIVSDSPKNKFINNNEILRYTFNIYEINKEGLKFIRKNTLDIKENIRNNIENEFKIINSLLKN